MAANWSTVYAYVLNNAGAIQGAPYTFSITNCGIVLGSDGSAFWCASLGGADTIITKIPVTGTGFVSTTWTVSESVYDIIFDPNNGLMLVSIGSAIVVVNPTSEGVAYPTAQQSMAVGQAIPVGDYALLNVSAGTVAVEKYLNASIVGISLQSVSAGNAGAPIAYEGAVGAGGYAINPITGTVGKTFDHSSANIPGNKGTILGSGVVLEGMV